MRSLMTLVLVMIAALPSFGCADTRDRWTPGDALTNNQSLQGVRKQIKAIDALAPHVTGFVALALTAMRADLAIVELNLKTIEDLHRAPENPPPFSGKASEEARNQTTQEHAKRDLLGWITLIGGYLAAAAGVAATVLNLPVVGPWLATTKVGQVAARVLGGKIVKVGLDGIKTISTIRAEAEKRPLGAAEVVDLAVSTFSPSAAKIADKVSDQIEAANGIKVTAIKELEAAAS